MVSQRATDVTQECGRSSDELQKVNIGTCPPGLKGLPSPASPPLYPARHPPHSVAACLSIVARRILSAWAPNHARPFTAHRSGQRLSGRRKHASKLTGSPLRHGTRACWAFKVLRSHRPRSAMRSMPGIFIEVRCLGCNTHQKSSVGPVPLIIRLENFVEVHRGSIVPD